MNYSRPTRSVEDLDKQRRILFGGAHLPASPALKNVLGKPAQRPLVDTAQPAVAAKPALTAEQQAVADANRKARDEARAKASADQAAGIEAAAKEANAPPATPASGKRAKGTVVPAPAAPKVADSLLT